MTWTCPTCGRDYPDSGIGVPTNHEAHEMEGCKVCWESPTGTSRFVRPDSHAEERDNEVDEYDIVLTPYDMDHLKGNQPIFKGVDNVLVRMVPPPEEQSDE